MTELTKQQRRAVECDAPNVLCLAVAGSGKTEVLANRIARMISRTHPRTTGIAPEDIACITYTNAAADEMRDRLKGLIGADTRLAFLGTLHGWMFSLLRKHAGRVGLPETVSVIDDEFRDELLVRVADELGYKMTKDGMRDAIKCGPVHWIGDAFFVGNNPTEQFNHRYYMSAFQSGLLDFDAVLQFGLRLAKLLKSDDVPTHLLVDEINDASPIDLQIYDTLPVISRFFVGDLSQQIFSFRSGGGARQQLLAIMHSAVKF